MPVKFEWQFKYRDESNVNAVLAARGEIAKVPILQGLPADQGIWFTLRFAETITIRGSRGARLAADAAVARSRGKPGAMAGNHHLRQTCCPSACRRG